jgi:predicted flap endonuclease-1-like 5' DNA nuclease
LTGIAAYATLRNDDVGKSPLGSKHYFEGVFMAGLMCCLWWFLAGVLLGWLLNWLFDKFFRRGGNSSSSSNGGNGGNAGNASNQAFTQRAPVAAPVAAQKAATITPAAVPAPVAVPLAAASVAASAATFGFGKIKTSAGYDNFEIIEGIGPKINEVMHNAGVHTFAALAALDIPGISKILDAAGPNFKLANPETWAKQAALCATGDWEKLKAWQDELVAGVSITKDIA